ncbi:MAG: DUF2958 domain-containing protein [Candidatus Methanofastidiosum sp.]|nr:DUF2958 domain-containing protein [Methanofastidiosum sp.]
MPVKEIPKDWLTLFSKNAYILIPVEMEEYIPPIAEVSFLPAEKMMLWVKLFSPVSNWTWYVAAYDPENRVAFGYVEGFENEWGDFSIEELETTSLAFGLKIERDLLFTPKLFSKLKEGSQ